MKNGGYSLYLDYSIDGLRHREFLSMYLVEEKTKIDKLQNQETMKQAIALQAKKTIAVQSGEPDIRTKSKDMLVVEYMESRKEDYIKRGHDGYQHVLNYVITWLKRYSVKLTMKTLTKKQILDFTDYLRSHVSPGTVHLYFQVFNTQMRAAVREGIIKRNPFTEIESYEKPVKPDAEREYLTIQEVRRLAETDMRNNSIKQAFLFSCFTGLRISDIELLTWDKIRQTDNGWQIELSQKKTKSRVYIPMSDNAMSFLPQFTKKKGLVWPHLPKRCNIGHAIDTWVRHAKIQKHISFHCARHTYATLLLTNGADLYTVSKLLGHSDIKTTVVYAKIVDAVKREAVNAIPRL